MNIEQNKKLKLMYKEGEIKLPKKGFVPRNKMPQIKSTDVKSFLKKLSSEGIKITKKYVNPKKIKYVQNQFDIDKIKQILSNPEILEKPILLSNDYFALDGNHRAIALLNLEKKAICYQIDLSIEDLLEKANSFEKVFYKSLTEDKQTSRIDFERLRKIYDRLNLILGSFSRKKDLQTETKELLQAIAVQVSDLKKTGAI